MQHLTDTRTISLILFSSMRHQSHFRATVKVFNLEAFRLAFVFHCVAEIKLLQLLDNDSDSASKNWSFLPT